MIIVHRSTEGRREGEQIVDGRQLVPGESIPKDALWIDMIEPTRDEDRLVEAFLGISIPTREEMQDIEPSELLYLENDARYLTARLLYAADSDEPSLTGVTFILKDRVIVTVRYAEPRAFAMFAQRASKPGACGHTPEQILAGLIDTIVDRAADVLQMAGENIDTLSNQIFRAKREAHRRTADYQRTLKLLGHYGSLVSKQRESLVSVERLLLFVATAYRSAKVPLSLREDVRTTLRDVQSLEEHATFQSGKIQFLLDATLGLVNLEQNNIIKLFSVMAVVFMPPTLIASIYGMNFNVMPELQWTFGYPLALVAMVVAAILPYFFFRWKKWL